MQPCSLCKFLATNITLKIVSLLCLLVNAMHCCQQYHRPCCTVFLHCASAHGFLLYRAFWISCHVCYMGVYFASQIPLAIENSIRCLRPSRFYRDCQDYQYFVAQDYTSCWSHNEYQTNSTTILRCGRSVRWAFDFQSECQVLGDFDWIQSFRFKAMCFLRWSFWEESRRVRGLRMRDTFIMLFQSRPARLTRCSSRGSPRPFHGSHPAYSQIVTHRCRLAFVVSSFFALTVLFWALPWLRGCRSDKEHPIPTRKQLSLVSSATTAARRRRLSWPRS